jgi:hypothetical protein
MSPGDQTTDGTEADGPTTTIGDQIIRPCTTPSWPASSTSIAPRTTPTPSVVPHATPMTPHAPCVAPVATTPATPPVVLVSQVYPQHYSCCPRATWKPSAPPLHQKSPPAKTVPVAPSVNPHTMTTQVKWSFRLPTDKLTLSATSVSTLLPVPSFIHTSLIDLNWCRTMEQEFAALVANNT